MKHNPKQSQEFFHILMERGLDGIWSADLVPPLPLAAHPLRPADIMSKGRLTSCNEVIAAMLGDKKADDWVGRDLSAFFKEWKSDPEDLLKAFISQGFRLYDFETFCPSGIGIDLKKQYFRHNLYGVVENGQLLRIWGTQKDVTKEVASREELKKSERRLSMAVEAGRTGLWEWQIKSNKLFWTDTVKDIYETPRDQDPTMESFRALIHPEDRQITQERIRKALDPSNHEPYISYHRIVVNGQVKWVQGYGEVTFDEAQQPVEMRGTVIDVTDRKKSEETLLRLNEVGHALARAITTADVCAIFESFAIDVLNVDALAVYEMRASHLQLIHAHAYREEDLRGLSRLKEDSKVPYSDAGFQRRAIFVPSQGELRACYPHLYDPALKGQAFCAVPLFRNEQLLGAIGMSFRRDCAFDVEARRFILTFADQCGQALERARLYETERRARLEAEAANQSKSRFLANMSHEIRTPLGAILGFAELISDASMSETERSACVDTILRNGQLLGKVINDILDLSKIESEKLEIENSDFELIPTLEDVLDLLSIKASEKGLALHLKVLGALPRSIHSDPTRFRQVLMNLIGNAIKFTLKGGIELSVRDISQDAAAVLLEFVVHDSGIGIDHAHIERIFEPFTQADTSTSRRFGGTGLGLTVARSLARALGGDLRLLHSELGVGSSFVFTLPTRQVSSIKAAAAPSAATAAPRSLDGIRVLLVDDGPDNLRLIKRILTMNAALVETACDGQEAIDKALGQDFDILVMDLQMPGIDGFSAVRHLKEKGYEVPILALTANAMKGDREESIKAGFCDHLVKPIDRGALIAAILKFALPRS